MTKKLWGGRFSKKTDPLVEEFTKSVQYDYKLAECDIIGSVLHVSVLKSAGYLNAQEAKKLTKELEQISAGLKSGKLKINKNDEDIHTFIQNALQKKVGSLALKLHTARSRNDQVVFATKLYCKFAITKLNCNIESLKAALINVGMENAKVILPGFTHMQHAQPVSLKDYFSAYEEMLERDSKRLDYIFDNLEINMGSGALAGTPIMAGEYSIKAGKLIKTLGLDTELNIHPTNNSLDTVSDRDFVIEILSVLSTIGMHLSRLAEDLIIWSTKEFDFVEIDESFCTGSSLMPQKKNADTLELIRGYCGRLYGNLVSVLTMMKGLPLTYNRDMQLDKEPLFDSFEIVEKELKILTGLISTLRFNKDKIEEQLKDESLYATDLVYYLVNKGVAFKDAHTIIGKLVKYSLDNSIEIKSMPESLLKKFSGKIVKKDIIKLFDPKVSVNSKKSINRQKRK
ncbi:MAG: argininosuccinate lyase [Candidatus Omnitrophota bacterium]|jgi:argininosuccinate lyase|nr:MAG: argininosuccinate lyase [Candidatus Omnitrophota bacterium]